MFGTSGYDYHGWYTKNISKYVSFTTFYPESVKNTEQSLVEYAKHFDVVEINNTFYKLPKKETIQKWYKLTPPNFKFILKFSRFATHAKKLIDFKTYFDEFWDDNIDQLQEKCLGILIQLPPSFVNSNKKSPIDHLTPFQRLERASEYIKFRNLNIKIFIEFRHASWFGAVFNQIFDLGFYPVYVNLNNRLKEFSNMASGFSPPLDKVLPGQEYIYLRCHGTWKGYHGGYTQEDLIKMHSLKSVTNNLIVIFDNTDTLEAEVDCPIPEKRAFKFSKNILLPHAVLNAKQIQELDQNKYTSELWKDS